MPISLIQTFSRISGNFLILTRRHQPNLAPVHHLHHQPLPPQPYQLDTLQLRFNNRPHHFSNRPFHGLIPSQLHLFNKCITRMPATLRTIQTTCTQSLSLLIFDPHPTPSSQSSAPPFSDSVSPTAMPIHPPSVPAFPANYLKKPSEFQSMPLQ